MNKWLRKRWQAKQRKKHKWWSGEEDKLQLLDILRKGPLQLVAQLGVGAQKQTEIILAFSDREIYVYPSIYVFFFLMIHGKIIVEKKTDKRG